MLRGHAGSELCSAGSRSPGPTRAVDSELIAVGVEARGAVLQLLWGGDGETGKGSHKGERYVGGGGPYFSTNFWKVLYENWFTVSDWKT